eukprot:CAMPEP_0177497616 /NCGR_PEP_ID=MMETSP0369-20130122/35141_1 /TAXON_ID=447022 ORGANISM="Scrippsiella hangoei-like, Strain SHHI-4" /NCGR_SAMPLE_ID=MMETSP0369 /ASSEMBLY_ACC=CAM_ASM_000364 /LENGTH=60 /DNA_ID=CAMNT_0018974777 /DNA_START=290 /DNA_END=468 /DNA_ORIENTATION=-
MQNNSNANSHSPPFTQALTAALYVMVSLSTRLSAIWRKSCIAHSHLALNEQALTAALYVT